MAFLAYAATVAPDLTWANYGGDGGELITASVTLGVPHPPGYPIYTVLGKLASYLPVGTIAFRYNLFSALMMALAAGFVAVASRNLLSRTNHSSRINVAAIAAGLSFAFNQVVWSQAVIAEVYALNLLFLGAFLWMATGNSSGKRTLIVGLLAGLSVTSHLTSILIIPLGLVLIPFHFWPALSLGLGFGLIPLTFLPVLAHTNSPIVWGDPTSFSGWLAHVSGQLYQPNVFGLLWVDWADRIVQWGTVNLRQFVLLTLPFVALGAIIGHLKIKRTTYLFMATSVMFTIYAATNRVEDALVFMIPAIMLLTILAALGLRTLGSAALFLPLVLVTLNLNTQDLSKESTVRDTALHSLRLAPRNALLLTPGDQTITSLWYFQHVEGQRPDLILIDSNLFQFEWYRKRIEHLNPDLRHLERDDLDRFIQSNGQLRSVCFVSLVAMNDNHCVQPPI